MTLAVTIILPAGYFAIAYRELVHELTFAAHLKANRLARYIYTSREFWQYQKHRLDQLIEVPEADESAMRQRIYDGEGKLVLEAGAEPAAPLITVDVPLVVAGSTVGAIETAASLRPLLAHTALVSLLGAVLGFATFFIMRVVPLRAIDRTLADLDDLQVRYRRLFDASPFITLVIDRATSRLLDANEAAVRQYGWSREELLAKTSNEFYPPEDLPTIIAARARFLADPSQPVPPLRHRRKDGTVIDVEQTILPLEFAGRAAYMVMARDVTERNRAMKELHESERKYEDLIESLPVGIVETTADARIVTANAAWRRIFGFGKDEDLSKVDGHTLYANPADRAAVMETMQNDGPRPAVEAVFRRRDGTLFPIERYLTSVRDEHGKVVTLRGIVIDITQRKLLEAQLHQAQKMEAVGKLTGGIAHDFNNIMMIMMANVEALEDDEELGRSARRRVAQISRAVERAADLTRSLLAFSRKLPLNPRRLDLNALVVDTGRLLQRTLGSEIEIEAALGDDLWLVEVDRSQFENALVNLCLNSRDAMPNGGRVLIETANVQLDREACERIGGISPGAYVRLAVIDSGTGIPPDALPRVFDPFFTTKEVGKGTGLGLSMVQGFIIQSKGHIDILSEPKRGTTVTIHLPRASSLRESDSSAAGPALPSGREEILVVEDEPRVRSAMVEQLQSLGYAVTPAADGAAGIAACQAAGRPFDLLLTDVVMPGITGKALADEVSRRWPQTAILFMSGYSRDTIVHDSRLDPGARLIAKPFRKADLALAVRKALDGDDA
ncbi:PAS domain S-box protein [Reyranella sp.]|uniref:hybrid sensor histidine kinase/response regulator n=1 Tax=Reyranella sp. TaxID=1929291 RepID=UPI003D0B1916